MRVGEVPSFVRFESCEFSYNSCGAYGYHEDDDDDDDRGGAISVRRDCNAHLVACSVTKNFAWVDGAFTCSNGAILELSGDTVVADNVSYSGEDGSCNLQTFDLRTS